MTKFRKPGEYAKVGWSIGDVQTMRPEWSMKEAHEWLAANEKYIRDSMLERGWQAIDELLPAKK